MASWYAIVKLTRSPPEDLVSTTLAIRVSMLRLPVVAICLIGVDDCVLTWYARAGPIIVDVW